MPVPQKRQWLKVVVLEPQVIVLGQLTYLRDVLFVPHTTLQVRLAIFACG